MSVYTKEFVDKAIELKNERKTYREIGVELGVSREAVSSFFYRYRKGQGTKDSRTWTDEQLIDAVRTSHSLRQVIIKTGIQAKGTNYRCVKKHIKRLNLDTSHFTGQAHLKNRHHNFTSKCPLEDLLVENGIASSSNLSKRIKREGLLPYKCAIKGCGISTWLGKPVSLHIDHINGINNDNRLENLQFICPNCHSQTPTYCRKKSSLKVVSDERLELSKETILSRQAVPFAIIPIAD